MTSLISASPVVQGQMQSLDSFRAHSLPSDAMIYASSSLVNPANQNPGSYALVESANSLTLTTTGSVPVVTQSPFADLYKEGSLYFNGTAGNYVSATATGLSGTQWNTTGLTVEAWVNYTTFTGAAYQSSAQNQPNLLGFGGFSWQFGSNISSNMSFYYWTNGTTPVTYMATTPISANTWNHIAFTCTSSGTGYMFINGVQSQILTNTNGTISGPASTVSITGTPTLSGSTLYLNQNIGGTAGVFGYVADVRITTGAALYTANFTVPSAPLSPAVTGVGQALIRAGQNAPTIQNGALTFDRGVKSYMNFGPQTFNIVTQGFTAVWKGTLTGVVGNYEIIFEGGQVNSTNGWIALIRAGTSSSFYFAMAPSNSFSQIGGTGSVTLNQNTPYVIATRYNPVTQVADIWVNGVQISAASSTITTAQLVADRTLNAYIGYNGIWSFTSMTSNTLAIYNRALSNTEIYNSYLALSTTPVGRTIEIGDINGTPALSVAGDGKVSVQSVGLTSNVLPWPPAALSGYDTLINGGVYKARASSDNGANFSWMAFDKNINNIWVAQTAGYATSAAPYGYTGAYTFTDVNGTAYPGEWLQIQLPTPIMLSSYIITPSGTTTAAAKFFILGSRDGVSWSLIDFRTFSGWVANTPSTFTLATPATQAFTYFRISINQLNGNGGNAVINEWTLYGTADASPALTVAPPTTFSSSVATPQLVGVAGSGFAPQDFSASGLNIPAYVVSNTATTANTVAFSSFGPFAGEGSVYFPGGTGAYVNFGTQMPVWTTTTITDATFEAWIYLTVNSGYNPIFSRVTTLTSGTYDWRFYIDQYNRLYVDIYNSGKGTLVTIGTSFVTLNSWTHVAWTVKGGISTVFINGAPSAASATLTNINYTSNAITTIGQWNNTAGNTFNGYIASARIVLGLALYQTSFTPPTGPLQPIQGTTQAGLPYGTVLLLRNAPVPGRIQTQKLIGAGALNGVAGVGALGPLSFPPAAMTSYATSLSAGYGQGTYVASASSEYSGYGAAWQAFDKTNGAGNNTWASAQTYNTTTGVYTGSVVTVDINGNSYSGEWLQIQLPVSIILSSFTSTPQTNVSVNSPYNFVILGSRDGINWFLVFRISNYTSWVAATPVTFSVTSSQAFNYFRLVGQQIQPSNSLLDIGELVYNGTIEGANFTSDGRLGLGSVAPTRALEVAGDAVVAGTVSSGTGLMFRNALYNGDFRIAQRGTSFSSLSSVYTLDRWFISQYGAVGNGTLSQIQSGLANFSNALQLATTSTTNGNWWLTQSLETRDVVRFQGQPVTVSFWYRIPTSFTASWGAGLIWSTATDTLLKDWSITYTSAGSLSLTNTTAWTYGSFTGFVPLTAQSLAIQFTSYNNVVNGAQIQITGVQLEKGLVATPFEVRPYGVELQLCQRYYEQSYEIGTAPGAPTSIGMYVLSGSSDGNPRTYATVKYAVPKRIVVTPTFYTSTGTLGSWNYYQNGTTSTSAVSMYGSGPSTTSFATYQNVTTAWAACNVTGHWVANAEL